MYWDTLTTVGVIVSIVSILGAFYLELRNRPVTRLDEPRET
ncbi:MAG: hypothetical protein OEN49_04990 [Gammaproteobacteria bacterium]|nr:hypothetical protein [Gammaproteobacteria bacterium]MDH3562737.1 hypothetical protein [Gammaproteobacteria bacterium]